MVINKPTRTWLGEYTFIDKVTYKHPIITLHYKGGKKKIKYSATVSELQKVIEEIKKELGYWKEKELRDKNIRKVMKEKETIIAYTS